MMIVQLSAGAFYAQTGREAEARSILQTLLHKPNTGQNLLDGLCVALKDYDGVIAALNRAFDDQQNVFWLRADPMLDPLRSDPRFQALLKRIDSNQLQADSSPAGKR